MCPRACAGFDKEAHGAGLQGAELAVGVGDVVEDRRVGEVAGAAVEVMVAARRCGGEPSGWVVGETVRDQLAEPSPDEWVCDKSSLSSEPVPAHRRRRRTA